VQLINKSCVQDWLRKYFEKLIKSSVRVVSGWSTGRPPVFIMFHFYKNIFLILCTRLCNHCLQLSAMARHRHCRNKSAGESVLFYRVII